MKIFLTLTSLLISLSALFAQVPTEAPVAPARDPEAERLLKRAIDKLSSAQSLVVEYATNPALDRPFWVDGEVTLLRPNYMMIEDIANGLKRKYRTMRQAADGKTVWHVDLGSFIVYRQPLRLENFYYRSNPVAQYFFNPVLEFDPADPVWGRSVSLFDTNKEAYNRSVTTKYLGESRFGDLEHVEVVEVKFNTKREQITQMFYIQDDLILSIVTTLGDARSYGFRFNNYRLNEPLKPESFRYSPPEGTPVQEADPVRLGEKAPDFELPLNTGGEAKLSELLKGKKGVLVVALNGAAGSSVCKGPDFYLPQMRLMQEIRDKFESQGLEVIAVVGGNRITPDIKEEMLRNWLPDQTRFSYPIALDLDLERGIQGSAYQNFQLNGRNNVLLDKDGRVVFACRNFDNDRINELALYQALSQIGFAVSPADLELKDIKRLRN